MYLLGWLCFEVKVTACHTSLLWILAKRTELSTLVRPGLPSTGLDEAESCWVVLKVVPFSLHVPTIVWYRWADIWPSVFEYSGQTSAILNSRGLLNSGFALMAVSELSIVRPGLPSAGLDEAESCWVVLKVVPFMSLPLFGTGELTFDLVSSNLQARALRFWTVAACRIQALLWWCFDDALMAVSELTTIVRPGLPSAGLDEAESCWVVLKVVPFMSLPLFGTGELTFDLVSSNIQARALRFWTVEACRIQALLWWCFDDALMAVSELSTIVRPGLPSAGLDEAESCWVVLKVVPFSLHVPTIVWYRWADIWPRGPLVFEYSGQSSAILNSRGL